MITPTESAYITEHAYVPEHLPHYVTAISQTEPFLIGEFVLHAAVSHIVFVGYPLAGNYSEDRMLETIDKAKASFSPGLFSIIAPGLPAATGDSRALQADKYYRLDLSNYKITRKTGSMLKRARREVSVSAGKFGKEHERLVKKFMRSHRLDSSMQLIFRRLSEYANCNTAVVFDARTEAGDLAGFDIADYGSGQYVFYMFNIRSSKHNIPGVSDLLLAHIIERGLQEGKRYINMGLGVNAGIAFFKKKWGAKPFLRYISCYMESPEQKSWGSLLDKLS